MRIGIGTLSNCFYISPSRWFECAGSLWYEFPAGYIYYFVFFLFGWERWSVNDVWSDLSRGRAKLVYRAFRVISKWEKTNRQKQKSKSKLVGHYYYYLVSRIRFVVWIVCCSRHSWSLCTHMCVCCTQWRASNLSNIFRSRYPPDSSINRSFTDIFLFRCVYRDGNRILLLHVFSLACVYFFFG